MPTPDRSTLNEIMAILGKDAEARKALQIYAGGTGTLGGMSQEVRRQAARIVTEAPDTIGIHDRDRLVRFILTYGMVRSREEHRTEIKTVKFSPSDVANITKAAERHGMSFATYAYEAAVRAAEKELGI